MLDSVLSGCRSGELDGNRNWHNDELDGNRNWHNSELDGNTKGHNGELDGNCHKSELNGNLLLTPNAASKFQDSASVTLSPKLESEGGDIDDDLDPAMKEELDRLLEIFNSFFFFLF